MISILYSFHIFLMILQKSKLLIASSPRIMKSLLLVLIHIIIMISFLNLTSFFLFYNFVSLIVKHSLLSNSINSITIFIGLLFLWNCLVSFMLPGAILIIAFLINFTISTHCWWAYKGLADIWSFFTIFMNIFMH